MSAMTLSGAGRSLLIWDDTRFSGVLVKVLVALLDRNERFRFGAGVVGGWADDLAILSLLDDMGTPASGSGDDEQRREEIHGNAHQVVGHGAVPVEVREHAFGIVHGGLDALGNVE